MWGSRWWLCAGGLALCAAPALGATEVEKHAAIDRGIEWLAQQQTAGGYWAYADQDQSTAATGAALLAFLEEGWKAGDDVVVGGNHYGDVVGKGLTYLLSRAQIYNISGEPAGNPDGDGNGKGVKFVLGGDDSRDTYVTGLVLPAIAKSGTPDKLVTTGPLAARTDGTGAGGKWTYRDVVQNTVDYFAYGQADSGWARGGWRYYADYNQSDNSTAQWPAIGMLFAQAMGVSAPNFVKDEHAYWVDYIQDGASGGSGYDGPTNMISESKTGGLLVEMVFAGDSTTGVPYNLANADLQAALGYLNTHWKDGATGTWYGNFGHPYAMWAVYKGLEQTVGLYDTTEITNLRNQATVRAGGAPLDAGDTWTWWEDYSEYLVQSQSGDGSWGGYSYWYGPLATAWNINILNATQVPGQPSGVPLPSAAWAGLGGLALVALLRSRRRRPV